MITSVGDWPQLHEAIAGELATSECKSVLVFVSGADVDAVAAARTLKARPWRCVRTDLHLVFKR